MPYAHYDPETDSMMVRFSDQQATETEEVAPNILISYGRRGKPVAIEFVGGVRPLLKELLDAAAAGSVDVPVAQRLKTNRQVLAALASLIAAHLEMPDQGAHLSPKLEAEIKLVLEEVGRGTF